MAQSHHQMHVTVVNAVKNIPSKQQCGYTADMTSQNSSRLIWCRKKHPLKQQCWYTADMTSQNSSRLICYTNRWFNSPTARTALRSREVYKASCFYMKCSYTTVLYSSWFSCLLILHIYSLYYLSASSILDNLSNAQVPPYFLPNLSKAELGI